MKKEILYQIYNRCMTEAISKNILQLFLLSNLERYSCCLRLLRFDSYSLLLFIHIVKTYFLSLSIYLLQNHLSCFYLWNWIYQNCHILIVKVLCQNHIEIISKNSYLVINQNLGFSYVVEMYTYETQSIKYLPM